ncbi:MarR family transcriptional regulator, partial [Rhizobium ruizarguesonis]
KAFRTDVSSEASFLQARDGNERYALAALLRKLIAGMESEQARGEDENAG